MAEEKALQFFDSHAHYDDEAFDEDREEVLDALEAAGHRVMNLACDLPSADRGLAIVRNREYMVQAVGVHPNEAQQAPRDVIDRLRALVRAEGDKIRAIGEIGLDYHYDDVPPGLQKELFRAQLALAEELHLPVSIHDREAHGDTLAIISEFPKVRGILHCFSGSTEMAAELVKRGYWLGFGGVITFKNARKPLESAAAVPDEALVIETDSPYCTPVPFRGKRNDSRMLRYVCEKLAEIRGTTDAEIASLTFRNAAECYGLR